MRVTHLYHSGFLVDMGNCSLLFDWYPASTQRAGEDLKLFARSGTLYVFVSHAHADHYVPAIWDLGKALPDAEVTYIVDEAVAAFAPKNDDLDIVSCEPEQIYEIDENMEVTTLNSTDEGLAFCVDVLGKTIYHAGDLSVWWWPNREHELNLRSMRQCTYFLEILEGRHIDLAMLPITPRAGSEGDRGIELFMKRVGADVVVPMHYGDDLAGAKRLASSGRLAPWRDRIRFDDQFEL